MIYKSIYETIGNTPVVKINMKDEESAEIYAKLEYLNAGSSVKDRVAKSMILNMLEKGEIDKDTTLVEATSGNTGIGIAMVSSALGIKFIATMPETMSIERRQLLNAYGATIVLTKGSEGMAGAISEAEELGKLENHVVLHQFSNEYNTLAHINGTATEIINDFTNLDAFVAGIGTGGTITGNGKVLKEHYKDIKIIGVEPESSPFLTKSQKGPHKIQGIGAGFKPDILDMDIIDSIELVSNEDAFEYARLAGKNQGILLGISGGAAFKAAVEVAKKLGKGKKVLFIAPDNGERYLSTELYK